MFGDKSTSEKRVDIIDIIFDIRETPYFGSIMLGFADFRKTRILDLQSFARKCADMPISLDKSRRCVRLINSLSIPYPIDKATPSEHSEGVLIILSFSSISLLRTC